MDGWEQNNNVVWGWEHLYKSKTYESTEHENVYKYIKCYIIWRWPVLLDTHIVNTSVNITNNK